MSGDDASNRPAPRRRELSVDEYLAGIRHRDRATLARALTLVESNHAEHRALAEALLARLPSRELPAKRVGISGAPGAGKSTFVEALGVRLVRAGHSVAVLAVDPSSHVSGGSVLGDKTRMTKLAAEEAAFIRPSPAAGTLGGVAAKTRECLLVCEAAGFDVVLIETVGVGQSETLVAEMTDCFVALMIPGAGDELQGIKRGLLEHVDVIAVNKADGATREAAEIAARQLKSALETLAGRAAAPRIFTCSALLDEGIDAVWAAVEDRFQGLVSSGKLDERRRRQCLGLLWSIVEDRLKQALRESPRVNAIRDEVEREVLSGAATPEAAARRILDALGL